MTSLIINADNFCHKTYAFESYTTIVADCNLLLNCYLMNFRKDTIIYSSLEIKEKILY